MLSLLKSLSFLIGHLPVFLTGALAKLFGSLAYRLAGRHRKTAMENLERAFGEGLTLREKERLAKKVFDNLAVMFFEFMRIPWLKPFDINRLYEVEGIENLKEALEKKKGVMIMTAHFGNWEMIAAYYGLTGNPIDIVARDLDNPTVDEFVKWARTRSGNRVVSKNRAMRRLLRTLSNNGIIGILLDQNVASNEGVFVDFFGSPACTNKGPALLAAASGAAIVPTFIVREGNKHRIIIGKEVEPGRTGDKERDALETTARCTKVIEEMIRKHPDHWFWVHRRWKTRPPA
ncbi:MAG: lysophospholipid acyltransferase family protein [Deltaproteobacteria bacterium]|nr:lysophospholipid acyltransferase family protein [Deltaproteobacteria bacterium]